jgi:hypothetical protein
MISSQFATAVKRNISPTRTTLSMVNGWNKTGKARVTMIGKGDPTIGTIGATRGMIKKGRWEPA